MARTGRPSRFNESLLGAVKALAERGATDVELAAAIGISPRTLTNWKGAHPDFLLALNDGKTVADDLVEATLFQRAIGYSQAAVKHFYNSKLDKVVEQRYIERFEPDTTACIFWLKNRRAEQWRANPPETDDEPEDGETIDADWKIEILGGAPATLDEMREVSIRYYDKKPPPLKIAGKPDEPS